MGILSSLNREQKEAVGLLQIGTFLEYFDLMLYVHMAVLLNELFFPKTDPHTAALLSAFAFCSTFVLRPFGALIFGYIGDTIGRKTTVIITTMMMSISCVIMANLPTYAQIGISATWIVTICRMIQGLSSMGEIMGAQIYVTEITKPPVQYPAVSFISIASSTGAVAALGIAALVTIYEGNWRIAFWIGAGIAVVGSMARTRLRETPDFVDMKQKMKREIEYAQEHKLKNSEKLIKKSNFIMKEKVNKNTLLAYFFIQCGWPLSFYLTFMYFNPLLQHKYSYTSTDIIFHNLCLSIIVVIISVVYCFLSYRIHPLIILKRKAQVFLATILLLPILIMFSQNYISIFALQSILLIISLGANPADSVFVKNFPIFKRFTATSFIYAMTRAVMYVITSFGLVYLTEWFGHYGLWIITLPVTIGFIQGVNHFVKLEQESGALPKQKIHQPLLPEVNISS